MGLETFVRISTGSNSLVLNANYFAAADILGCALDSAYAETTMMIENELNQCNPDSEPDT